MLNYNANVICVNNVKYFRTRNHQSPYTSDDDSGLSTSSSSSISLLSFQQQEELSDTTTSASSTSYQEKEPKEESGDTDATTTTKSACALTNDSGGVTTTSPSVEGDSFTTAKYSSLLDHAGADTEGGGHYTYDAAATSKTGFHAQDGNHPKDPYLSQSAIDDSSLGHHAYTACGETNSTQATATTRACPTNSSKNNASTSIHNDKKVETISLMTFGM